ncbi:hypothetical protein [Salimicrobium halophilum]|uniref:Ribosomal protein L7/L12 C-terminal domain-containing protein n=1 Tax=Salimicrobium halophilum TaxID=86666 RepID=A0A1G8R2B6_9BACI|nr:hypothetical protein [Salimicrobium halophilum]SDJ11134.1 hypothetical protein SAMN04490247_0778 [Salimicrobium halophilum]
MEGLVLGLLALSVFLFARLLMMKKKISRPPFSPDEGTEKEIRQLMEAGEDVKAVKLARERYGFSLIEGKQYIDKKKNAG